MNLLGKIFVGLILVMSLVFMAMAMTVYSAHRNWRDEIMRSEARAGEKVGYKKQLADATTRIEDLKKEMQQLQGTLAAEQAAKVSALAKLETELSTQSELLDTLKKDNQSKSKQLATAADALKVAQENLTSLRTEVDGLRSEIRTVQKETDEQFKKAVTLADKLHSSEGQLSDFRTRAQQLSTQLVEARHLMASRGIKLGDDLQAGVKAQGIVLAVSKDNLVELSIGSDDGLHDGDEFDVYRGATYVGRVKVVDTKPDKAVASIMPEFRQQLVQKGDNVTPARSKA